MIFEKYYGDSENYRLSDTVTKKIKVSRNVLFDKDLVMSLKSQTVNLQKMCEDFVQDNSMEKEVVQV